MSHYLRDRITNEGPNTTMERGIITGISYFLDQEFIVRLDPFPVNPVLDNPVPNVPVPQMPLNWRNNIINHQNGSNAEYFIRQKNQVFILMFTYSSRSRKVTVNVNVSS